MDTAEVTRNVLMYFILPLWLAAGFADYLCHRAAHIERTSGVKESLLHIAQFVQIAVPILAAMFLEINALPLMVVVLHWDQFLSLFGIGTPSFAIALKQPPLPWGYVATMLTLVLLFQVLPYSEVAFCAF